MHHKLNRCNQTDVLFKCNYKAAIKPYILKGENTFTFVKQNTLEMRKKKCHVI